MRLEIRLCPLAAALLCMAGCAQMRPQAPTGRDFAISAFANFALDQTSEAQAQASLGAPLKRSAVSGIAPPNSKGLPPGTAYSVTTLNYFYAPYGGGRPASLHPDKLALLSFFNDRLILYVEISLLPGESNLAVDESRLQELRQGQTTREQAIALLGTPNSQLLHVLDAQKGYRKSAIFGATPKAKRSRAAFCRSASTAMTD